MRGGVWGSIGTPSHAFCVTVIGKWFRLKSFQLPEKFTGFNLFNCRQICGQERLSQIYRANKILSKSNLFANKSFSSVPTTFGSLRLNSNRLLWVASLARRNCNNESQSKPSLLWSWGQRGLEQQPCGRGRLWCGDHQRWRSCQWCQ